MAEHFIFYFKLMQIQKRHFAEIIAEFLGTFVLVTVILMSSLIAPSASGFTIGFTLAALVLALSTFTMAHFNPIVTLGSFFNSTITNKKVTKVDLSRLVAYLLTQLLASLLAAALSMWVGKELAGFLGEAELGNTILADPNGATTLTNLGFVVEALFSFIFVSTILFAVNNKETRKYAGVPIGLMLLVLTMLASNITGASFHPFRSLATAFSGSTGARDILWVYLLAPTIGGSVAGLFVGVLNLLKNSPDRVKSTTVKQTTEKEVEKKGSKKTSKKKSSKK